MLLRLYVAPGLPSSLPSLTPTSLSAIMAAGSPSREIFVTGGRRIISAQRLHASRCLTRPRTLDRCYCSSLSMGGWHMQIFAQIYQAIVFLSTLLEFPTKVLSVIAVPGTVLAYITGRRHSSQPGAVSTDALMM